MTEPNQGANPPDFTTLVGQTRLVLGDTDGQPLATPVEGQGIFKFFSDAELSAMLPLYGNNPKATAARVLRTVAFSQVLLLKAFTSADLQVNGPAIADALRLLADSLDAEVVAGNTDFVQIVKTGGTAYETWALKFPWLLQWPSDTGVGPYPLAEVDEIPFYYPSV